MSDDLFPSPKPLALFTFEGADVRITDENGDPWFVAGDVAKALGHRDAEHLTRTLDDDEKATHIVGTLGGPQKVNLVSQPGLLRAITQRRASANLDPEIAAQIVRFQRWVFHDVLPSVLRTGSYHLPAPAARMSTREVRQTFADYRAMAKLIGLDAANATIAAGNATAKLTGVNPLQILGHTHFIAAVQENVLTATQVGAKFGLSAVAMNLRLQALGYQTPLLDSRGRHEKWEPTDKGKPFGNWSMTGKSHNGGTPVTQWRWYGSIVAEVSDRIAPLPFQTNGDVA